MDRARRLGDASVLEAALGKLLAEWRAQRSEGAVRFDEFDVFLGAPLAKPGQHQDPVLRSRQVQGSDSAGTDGCAAPSEPATEEPATGEPATAGQTTGEPATAESATAGQTTAEPATAEPGASEPGASEPGASEPAVGESTASEPRDVTDAFAPLLGPAWVDPIVPAPADLSDRALIEATLDTIRTVNIAHGRQLHLISELAHRRAGAAVIELTGRRAHGRQATNISARAVADELVAELTLTKHAATKLLDQAVGLSLNAAPTFAALQCGDIDLGKADAILDRVQTLLMAEADDPDGLDTAQMAEDLQNRILPDAASQNLTAMTRAATKAMINLDPEAAARRHRVKRERRHIRLTPLDDGMCELSAYLPADQAVRIMAALTALANAAKTPGDNRTLDQRRLDTLIDAIISAMHALDATGIEHHCEHPHHQHTQHRTQTSNLDDEGQAGDDARTDRDTTASATKGTEDEPSTSQDVDHVDAAESESSGKSEAITTDHLPHDATGTPTRTPGTEPTSARRSDAEVIIVISAETLIGINNDAAYLNGYGPLLADMARDIAATGTWRCAITNSEHGTLDGLGITTYTPSYTPTQKLRRHLAVRDRRCRFPGCTRTAIRCDIDHVCPYPDGPTCECNTECLCGHHHRIKHESGFTVRFSTDPHDPPGTLVWTTPGGREHLDYPEPLHPSHTRRARRVNNGNGGSG